MISLQESSPGVKNDQIRKKLFGKNIQKGEKKNFLFLLVGGKRRISRELIIIPQFPCHPQFSLSAK